MKLVDEPWETDQIYDTCKKKDDHCLLIMFELKTILGKNALIGYYCRFKICLSFLSFWSLNIFDQFAGKNEKLRENVSYFWQLVKDFKHIGNSMIASTICCK